jgi:hypothetical protein
VQVCLRPTFPHWFATGELYRRHREDGNLREACRPYRPPSGSTAVLAFGRQEPWLLRLETALFAAGPKARAGENAVLSRLRESDRLRRRRLRRVGGGLLFPPVADLRRLFAKRALVVRFSCVRAIG